MKYIKVPTLPPVGAYSSAVQVSDSFDRDRWYFLSGVIGINYKTGELEATSFEEEVRQVMENIKETLKYLKLDFDNVVKTTVYLTNMDNFSLFNDIYSKYFEKGKYPAREVIEVRRLPKNVNVEVSMILFKHIELEEQIEKLSEKAKEEVKEKLEEVKKMLDKLF